MTVKGGQPAMHRPSKRKKKFSRAKGIALGVGAGLVGSNLSSLVIGPRAGLLAGGAAGVATYITYKNRFEEVKHRRDAHGRFATK